MSYDYAQARKDYKRYCLHGLSSSDKKCLREGRISAHALHVAVRRCREFRNFNEADIGRRGKPVTQSEVDLADELNGMLHAVHMKIGKQRA